MQVQIIIIIIGWGWDAVVGKLFIFFYLFYLFFFFGQTLFFLTGEIGRVSFLERAAKRKGKNPIGWVNLSHLILFSTGR